ncbi:helix-turn-helix domain-containing protein [Thalassospira lucentensis]|uniref:helix-turn-helix domain-containing protein n=1 Tax=Thalassospira lucentensis TaxID=168935 RepID=UPI00142DF8E2|nr:XRE family transcriptional regulator [Thalassospira lucentensis]NIZ01196.1 ImmA/IrrE family metallo-endopeptidase [Thalassospira lucentensis]
MSFTATVFSSKLRRARENVGMSIVDVVQGTGIDGAKIKSFEMGDLAPTGDEILILADLFKCDLKWFLSNESSNPDENINLMLRAAEEEIPSTDRYAIAEFLHLCKCEQFLDEQLETVTFQRPFNFTPRGTYYIGHGADCARKLRQHFGLKPNAYIPDVFDWFRQTGLHIFRRSLPNSNVSGLFVNHPEAGKCILINFTENLYRQRFSLAHEVAHALIDADKAYNISTPGDQNSRELVEIRANSFASNFLISPEQLAMFGKTYWSSSENIIEIADRLFITVPALLSALKRDKVISDEEHAELRSVLRSKNTKIDAELSGDLTSQQQQRKTHLLEQGLHDKYVRKVFEAQHRKLISRAKAADMLLSSSQELDDIATLFGFRL